MKDKEFLKEIISRGSNADDLYFEYASLARKIIDKGLIEQLKQLVDGPIWDGDIISKNARGELFELGLAVRVCCKGEQGFTGATYYAYTILAVDTEE